MSAVEVLEAYVPARLEYLARLYEWLQAQLYSHPRPLLRGFSIYEVNGAFRGQQTVYEERTLVVRVIFDAPARTRARRLVQDALERSLGAKVEELARALLRELRAITGGKEEELWVIRVPGTKVVG